jgi:hypothetical protein
MRPSQWEPLPIPRELPPSWWERNGGAVLFVAALVALAALDILGI